MEEISTLLIGNSNRLGDAVDSVLGMIIIYVGVCLSTSRRLTGTNFRLDHTSTIIAVTV